MESKMIKSDEENQTIKTYKFEDLIGSSEAFLETIKKAKMAADTKLPVFIVGETGTGKELFAQSIHNYSDRKTQGFIAQNCAAIPETLFESILFGTTKGAFTGSIDRKGLFEEAKGGTLMLDEINVMPYGLQSKLLRALQENIIRRVGGREEIPIDIRIIATVNEEPLKLLERGQLRKDLYYRLNVINLKLPTLKERRAA